MRRPPRWLAALTLTLTVLTRPALAGDPAPKPAATTPAPGTFAVKVVPDLAYVEGPDADPKKHKLDLFLPEGKAGFPVVFFIHGGGWTSGDRKLYGSFGRVLARNGVGAAIVSYRLSPGVQHPGHIEDVARAFAWAHANIAKYGGRPDRIFVTGQSAGGHLAALLATDQRYLRAHGLTAAAVRGVMPISGVYRFPAGRFKRVLGDAPDAAESASPLRHVSGKEPPFLILYADRDFPGCAGMSRALDSALRDKKVESRLVEVADRNHISIMFRAMFSEADPLTRALLDFVARHDGPDAPAPKPAAGG